MFKYIKLAAVLYCMCLFACTTANYTPIAIHFSSDSNTIILANIEKAGLYKLKANLETDSTYQNLVSVLQTPAEDDSTSMEVVWPGKLSLQGDSLIFKPDRPFVKGKYYLVETMLNTKFATGKEIVKADVGHAIKPQQELLKR